MNIKSAYIYGFGKWQEYEWIAPDDSFIVISGENESGKSTLRQFFLFMLFGFPPKKREFYLPKTGGKMGGKLTLSTEIDGEITIERIHDRRNGEAICYLADGTTREEAWLRKRLKGMNVQTFSTIFSFDSNQLNQLRSISQEELGNVLLSIGMTGTDKIQAVEKKLDNELSQLFKPHGKKPQMNELLSELDEINHKWKELEQQEKTYNEKKQMENSLIREIESIQSERNTIAECINEQTKQLQVYPLMLEYHHLHQEYEQLPKSIAFPEQGVERYQSLKEQLLPIRSELSLLGDNLSNYRMQLQEMESRMIAKDTKEKLEDFLKESTDYVRIFDELRFKEQEINQISQEIENSLDQLNLGIALEDLRELSFPFYIEETWNNIKQEQEQIALETNKLESELVSLEQEMAHLHSTLKSIKTKMIDSNQLEELKQKIEKKRDDNKRRVRDEVQRDQRSHWKQLIKKRKKTSFVLLLLLMIIGTPLSIFAILTNNRSLLILGFLFIIVGVAQKLWLAHTSKQMDQLFRPNSVSIDEAIISDSEFQELEQQVDEQVKHEQEYNTVHQQLRQLQLDKLRLDERKHFYQQRQAKLEQIIKEQQDNYPFLNDINVNYWSKLYHVLATNLERYDKLTVYEKDCRGLHKRIQDYEQKLHSFCEQQRWEIANGTSNAVLEYIKALAEQQHKLESQTIQYQKWISQTEEQQRSLIKKKQPYQTEIQQLWDIANVSDEEAFMIKASLKKKKESINEQIEALTKQLEDAITHDVLEKIRQNSPKDKAALESEVKRLEKEYKNLDDLLHQKRQELSDVKSTISYMEGSEDYSSIKHYYYLKVGQLEDLAKKWAVLQVAKEQLLETKSIYQNSYLPRVMKKAAHYFEQLTDGKYIRLYAPLEGKSIQVENRHGIRYEINELSQGTKDQLHVSLRMALSEVMGSHHSLPFFIDDAFVHFDKKRGKVMIQLLREVAKKQQVLLFTCQDYYKKLAEDNNNIHFQQI